jgi:hypothetical protein
VPEALVVGYLVHVDEVRGEILVCGDDVFPCGGLEEVVGVGGVLETAGQGGEAAGAVGAVLVVGLVFVFACAEGGVAGGAQVEEGGCWEAAGGEVGAVGEFEVVAW